MTDRSSIRDNQKVCVKICPSSLKKKTFAWELWAFKLGEGNPFHVFRREEKGKVIGRKGGFSRIGVRKLRQV